MTNEEIKPAREHLLFVEGVGWVCPTCWAKSEHTYAGKLLYAEDVTEYRHVDSESTTASLKVFDPHNSDCGSNPRIECMGCIGEFIVPDVEITWVG